MSDEIKVGASDYHKEMVAAAENSKLKKILNPILLRIQKEIDSYESMLKDDILKIPAESKVATKNKIRGLYIAKGVIKLYYLDNYYHYEKLKEIE